MKKISFILVSIIIFVSCGSKWNHTGKKMIVLGFDGMDPIILTRMLEENKLPNLAKIIKNNGDFKPLHTSLPPQSPVAWSDMISGENPGKHGIFDFLHLNRDKMMPYFSTSEVLPSTKKIDLGSWSIPISGGGVKLLRRGESFWKILEDNKIQCTVFKIPSNFPPTVTNQRTLSGMGTPDLYGGYGTALFFTDKIPDNVKEISGVTFIPVEISDGSITTDLIGPANPYRNDGEKLKEKIKFTINKNSKSILISVGENRIILKEKEWSDWVKIEFRTIPIMKNISCVTKFYFKESSPKFELFVYPFQINPEDPFLPISTPTSYSKELYDYMGYFYTQGMAELPKVLSNNILSDKEWLENADNVFAEREKLFDYELNKFKDGVLFFYFSSSDLVSHMFWRAMDKKHPLYNEELGKKYGDVVEKVYKNLDRMAGKVLNIVDDKTELIIMSDHGFSPVYREFNVNGFLKEKGYLKVVDENDKTSEFLENVDMNKTKAFGFGLNGIYLNGSSQEENEIIAEKLKQDLENFVDPKTGKKVIRTAYISRDNYSGYYTKKAPDIIVGFYRGYKITWESALGKIANGLLRDDTDKWGADHCIDPKEVPGIVITNKKIIKREPHLKDISPTILSYFGITPPADIEGKNLF